MHRDVVLAAFEGRYAGDEHNAFVALDAAYLGRINEVAAKYLVSFGEENNNNPEATTCIRSLRIA